MTRRQLELLTVPELRRRCGEHGLRKYQHKGQRLRKADLIEQLAAASEMVYRVQPVTELVTVGNGARKWRVTEDGRRLQSAAYTEYIVLRIIGTEDDPTEVRYADPSEPDRSWKSRYRARQAIQERLIRERNSRQANGPSRKERVTTGRRRRQVVSQQLLDSRGRRGGLMVGFSVGAEAKAVQSVGAVLTPQIRAPER